MKITILSVTFTMLALAIGTSPALSQSPKPAFNSQPSAASQTPAPKAQPAAAPEPQVLTELEQTKVENLQLKTTLLRQQEQVLNAAYLALAEQIAKAHPGFILNPQTGQLQPAPRPAPEKSQEPTK